MKTKNIKHTSNKLKLNNVLWAMIALAFLVRLILAATAKGFESDVACFSGWASRVFNNGFSGFYTADSFTDYPPGYIYVLYFIGAIFQNFQIDAFSGIGLILLKMPSILCDIAAGYLIYRIGTRYVDEASACLMSGLYLFNPAVLLNSVVWGQVDSILALFVLLLCLKISDKQIVPACFIFAAGLLFKPQMLIFAPLLLYGIYEFEFLNFCGWQRFAKDALGGVASLLFLLLGMMPFGLDRVLPQYTDTLASYPYVSVNAYNFWAMLGLNWASQESLFLGITYAAWGTIAIMVLTLISAVIFEVLRRKGCAERYVLTGAFLITTTFMFSVRMHERYLYPSMLLLVFTALLSKKRAFVWTYLVISATHFVNVWHVLYKYDPGTYYETVGTVKALSMVVFASAVFFYVVLIAHLKGRCKSHSVLCDLSKAAPMLASVTNPLAPTATREKLPFNKTDFSFIAVITLVYGIVAFLNLGYMDNPETEYAFASGQQISLEFASDATPATLNYFLRTETDLSYQVQYSADGVNWDGPYSYSMTNVFSWGQLSLQAGQTHFIFTNTSEDGTIGEFIFTDSEGNPVMPLNAADYPELFDETDSLPATFDYRSSAYFDEIYYHRTANEFIEGLPAYENTHPPLGKTFMMIGALIFGTNPFGFRFMGALFGVLMLPFLYMLARNLLDNRILGAAASLCFAFDFMHFTQSRVSTVDVFIVFFIIVMYYFMEQYLRMSFYDTDLKKTFLPLGACGIAFGLGISSKWTGFYAGAGLAVLFFASLYKRYREYLYACKNPNGFTQGIRHQHIKKSFMPNMLKTIGFCMIFFVIVPFVLYTLSYIPFKDYTNDGLLARMWNNQNTMFSYHSQLTATHPYSSAWYEWPTMVRPVFYYSKILGNDMYQGISAFGNPAVWFTAIPAAICTFCLAIFKRKRIAGFLSVSMLAQFLPWLLVTRCTFLYHYFPSVPFLVLMIFYVASELKKLLPAKVFYTLIALYCIVVVGLFIMFYPVLSGMPVSGSYVTDYLRWNKDWVLVYNY